jgi:ATP/ADP translocase
MAKIDRIKEFINYLKVLLVLSLATVIGLVSWIANNYHNNNMLLLSLATFTVLILLMIVILINKKIIKDIKSLEEL